MPLPDNCSNNSNSTVCRQMMMITTASNIGNIEVETILLQKSWQLSKLLKLEGAGTLSPVTGAGGQ